MMTKGLRRDRNIIANGMIFFFFCTETLERIKQRRKGKGWINNGYLGNLNLQGELITQYLHNILLFGYCTLLVISMVGKLFYKQTGERENTSLELYDRKSSVMVSNIRMNLLFKRTWLITLFMWAQLCPTLCDAMDCSLPGSSFMGFSSQEYWSGLPFSFLFNLYSFHLPSKVGINMILALWRS